MAVKCPRKASIDGTVLPHGRCSDRTLDVAETVEHVKDTGD